MVHKKAKGFIRELGGNVDYISIEERLRLMNISIILYNTPQGDTELMRYNLTDKALKLKGFTYSGAVKIIFIDTKLSYEDKLYVLLHEVGHILLGHIGDCKLYARSKVFTEIEADAFAYDVLKMRKNNFYLASAPPMRKVTLNFLGKKGKHRPKNKGGIC